MINNRYPARRGRLSRGHFEGRSGGGARARSHALRSRAVSGTSFPAALRLRREVLSLDWDRRGRVTPAGVCRVWSFGKPVSAFPDHASDPRPRKHGLKPSREVKAPARAAAERRKASAPRSARGRARKAPRGGNAKRCRAASGWMRLSALRSLDSRFRERIYFFVCGGRQSSDTTCREKVSCIRPRTECGGGGPRECAVEGAC